MYLKQLLLLSIFICGVSSVGAEEIETPEFLKPVLANASLLNEKEKLSITLDQVSVQVINQKP